MSSSTLAIQIGKGAARPLLFALCILNLALAAGGCAKAKAATIVPDGPPLAVPAPPARVLAPVEEPPPVLPPPEAPAVVVTPPPPPARPPARPAPPRPDPPAAVQAPVTEPRDLRAAPSAAEAAAERSVRDTLARASRDLNRVDYSRLRADGRAQYEQSKRFAQQAEQAVRDRNLVFAASLADKAATLAAELLGR